MNKNCENKINSSTKNAVKLTLSSIAIIVVLSLTVPYIITVISSDSICLREGGISDKNDKIQGARNYFFHKNSSNQSTGTESKKAECCVVDKGHDDDPILSWFAYYAHGKSHYVHLLIEQHERKKSHNNTYWDALITVDNCGNGIAQGIDL